MYNFQWNIPTNLLFGKDQINNLPNAMLNAGIDKKKKLLLVYGGGSIKKTGLYDKLKTILSDYEMYELSGVQPNPEIESVRNGVKICREKHIDVIIACGGGSVIDAAKLIAVSVDYKGDPWEIMENQRLIKTALPIIAILTMAASGSEMDRGAVISNNSLNRKLAIGSTLFYPVISICDPTYLYSLSQKQTVAGIADIFSHAMEVYFNDTMGAYLSDRIAEAIMKTCIYCGQVLIKDSQNYEARANMMWTSTQAMNGILRWGRGRVVLPCHGIEHELGAYYNITHGDGLAILMPKWMRYTLNNVTLSQYSTFARNVWDINENDDIIAAEKGIEAFENFLLSLNLPLRLSDVGIENDDLFNVMAENAVINGELSNANVKLNKDDVLNILNMCK